MLQDYSDLDQEKINSDSDESFSLDEKHKIKIKMENIIKQYFKKDPSLLIYFITEAEIKIEKIDMDSIAKNNIKLEIKSWEKNFEKKSLIQIFLEVIKTNKIQTQNLNQILNEINYNPSEDNSLNLKQKINSIDDNSNTFPEINDIDEESLCFNSSISLENIKKINVNRDIKGGPDIDDDNGDYESSCNAEYFESTNFLPLEELNDIEMINNSKDKENNNTDNINSNMKKSKKNLDSFKPFSAKEFLKNKIKNNFSNDP